MSVLTFLALDKMIRHSSKLIKTIRETYTHPWTCSNLAANHYSQNNWLFIYILWSSRSFNYIGITFFYALFCGLCFWWERCSNAGVVSPRKSIRHGTFPLAYINYLRSSLFFPNSAPNPLETSMCETVHPTDTTLVLFILIWM